MSSAKTRPSRAHKHTAITAHALQQRAGIPYEVERTICLDCRRLLKERPLRRAAA
jgi:RNase P subunit RPR2